MAAKKERSLMFSLTHTVSQAAARVKQRCYGSTLILAVTVAVAAFAQSIPVQAQTPTSNIYAFTNLNDLANFGLDTYSEAWAISNGTAVGNGYGSNTNGQENALRWNADGTTTNLHSLANLGTDSYSSAFDIKNGVIVGTGGGSNTKNLTSALRWNTDGTVTNLNSLINLGSNTGSNARSTDNGVTVGFGAGSNTSGVANALRWNADGTVTNLHTLANLGFSADSNAYGISDGITIGTGRGSNTGGQLLALRWNANDTVTNLSALVNLGTNSSAVALGISNGVIAGYGTGGDTDGNSNAVRWNADGTVTNLHTFTNLGANSYSLAFNVGGGVTVGYGAGSNTNNEGVAVRWNADGTSLNLHQFVTGNVYSQANAIDSATGIITGSVGNHDVGTGSKASLWTPLNAGADGANSLTVQSEFTTTINQNFTQSSGQTVVNGSLAFDDANSGNGAEIFTLAGGLLGGAGTLTGTLVNTGGIVGPGNSPGTLTINGDYTQSGAGVLKIEIASPSSFDLLSIIGDASLGGTLDIHFVDAYVPSTSDFAFDFMQVGGNVTGMFDTINVTGGNITANQLTTQVESLSGGGYKVSLAVVVPEPGSIALLGLALPMMSAWIARRRNK